MAQDHKLQQQRFELKYLVDEAICGHMRDFISSHLELDDYSVGKPNYSYPVHSLYLDSDNLHTHQAVVNGTKNRFKLRLRFYDDKPSSPVFFEVKHRVNNCIMKRRCGVRRQAVAGVIAGHMPSPDQLFSKEARHWISLEHFCMLMNRLGARPRLHNRYLREAWVSSGDNSVRITFDRNVCVEPFFNSRVETTMHNPTRVYAEHTILELKFTSRFPNWCREMVRNFNLMQFAAAKYSGGVEALGENRLAGNQTMRARQHGSEFYHDHRPAASHHQKLKTL